MLAELGKCLNPYKKISSKSIWIEGLDLDIISTRGQAEGKNKKLRYIEYQLV